MARATFMAPMLASASGPPVTRDGWVFERKLDGLRCVAVRRGATVELWSRNHLSFTARFPSVVRALAQLGADDFVLDGELVSYSPSGKTDFSLLQQGAEDGTVVFAAFDLLHLLGQDVTHLPLTDRRALLEKFVVPGSALAISQLIDGEPDDLLSRACADGWEGLLAKRPEGRYKAGRSPDWRKLKCTASQELVIGGWTEPRGARIGFGALLVGYFEDGIFRYAGKVGTGFKGPFIVQLHQQLRAIEVATSPFADGEGEKGAHWCQPQLVANVAFTEWTRDGRLRHPSFQGLRPDKPASSVVREAR